MIPSTLKRTQLLIGILLIFGLLGVRPRSSWATLTTNQKTFLTWLLRQHPELQEEFRGTFQSLGLPPVDLNSISSDQAEIYEKRLGVIIRQWEGQIDRLEAQVIAEPQSYPQNAKKNLEGVRETIEQLRVPNNQAPEVNPGIQFAQIHTRLAEVAYQEGHPTLTATRSYSQAVQNRLKSKDPRQAVFHETVVATSYAELASTYSKEVESHPLLGPAARRFAELAAKQVEVVRAGDPAAIRKHHELLSNSHTVLLHLATEGHKPQGSERRDLVPENNPKNNAKNKPETANPLTASAIDDPKEKCPTVALNKEDQSMHQIPVRDQLDEGICYAESAADLIDAYQHSRTGMKKQSLISPIALAIETEISVQGKRPIGASYFTPREELLSGGNTKTAIDIAKKNGACPEIGALESREFGHNEKNLNRLFQEVHKNHKQFQFAKALAADKPPDQAETLHRVIDEQIQRNISGSVCTLKSRGLDVLDTLADDIAAILDFEKDDFVEAALDLIATSCKKKNRISLADLPDAKAERVKDKEHLLRLVNDRFSKARVPIQPFSISICYHFLKHDPSFEGRSKTNPTECIDDKGAAGGHQVTVIGSEYVANESEPGKKVCKLKIKNSWGTGCRDYGSKLKAQCTDKDGIVSIDINALGNNIMEAIYLDVPPNKASADSRPSAK